MTEAVHPPGLDLIALRRWLDQEAPGVLDGTLRGWLFPGGKSNLTYRISDGAQSVVVRRPPMGHVLATAHDMAREYRIISALQGTPVPVPRTYALCLDPSVLGAPFYVMSLVVGVGYLQTADLTALGEERTRGLGERMVDTLGDLHALDPEAVGLADFGRPEGFLARQVRRWGQQLDSSRSRELAGEPALRAALSRSIPEPSAPAILHGDYRFDNLLINTDDRIAAVVDWEMATLGDPLTDVAMLLTYQRVATFGEDIGVSTASLAAGFPSRAEMLERYARRTGRDLSRLGFYEALACFKLAVILEGIHYRHLGGLTVGDGFAQVGEVVEPLLALGLESIEEDH